MEQAIFPIGIRPPLPHRTYAHIEEVVEVPNLIGLQLASFQWLQENGIKQLLEELSPIRDFTGNRLELSFVDYEFRGPHLSEQECAQRDQTYAVTLYVKARLLIRSTGEIKEPFDLFFGDMPMMTAQGTFITSGTERVIVNQLLRSPGVYFTISEDPVSGRRLCNSNLIPSRGAWLDFETSIRDVISVKIDGKRKIPVTTLLRAIGFETDKELLEMFAGEDNSPDHHYIQSTIDRDGAIKTKRDALLDIYRKMRPGDPPNEENAAKLLENMFFKAEHYDLGLVGRYKLNRRLGLPPLAEGEGRALTSDDMAEIVRRIIMVNNGQDHSDDIDHLGNRRIRTVGELIQNQLRIGLMRLERVARERMSILSTEALTPQALVNIRPVVSAVREFFGGSQLSQFMDQTNPLAELTNKRRLSAMGPGGLSRDRAGFDVRDVHFSHYGRICPIETPEGPNIGLIGSLATFGRINRYGFVETPYRRVKNELDTHSAELPGRKPVEDVVDGNGEVLLKAGEAVTRDDMARLAKLPVCKVSVPPFVSGEVEYMQADTEDKYNIGQANTQLNELGEFVGARVEARFADQYLFLPPSKIEYMDVSPKQIFSVATSLIPFLEHDDANRALMGANMQRQGVPLVLPEAPLVATGMETQAARYSGQVLFSHSAGTVASVTSFEITIVTKDGREEVYPLKKFVRTNQGTCINQRPVVNKGDKVEAGQVLADSSATERGELALGQNVVAAFMSWGGYNYEDAIIVSDRLVERDKFTSIHISKHEVEARDTKLGPEEITRDIPNVGEENLRELDENGIIRIGAEVEPGDILVGKITPKGETELSAEEKLLRAIFGEKAREVKDTSLRVPHGESGKVINVRIFTRDDGDELPVRVNKWVQVWVAQKRKISVGDKLAGRHGNKGVISIVAPVEDMPYLPDGTPVDIVLNPIGVPSRMNLGQIMETHLGWAGQMLGFKAVTPVFDGATDIDIEDGLGRVWMAQQADAVLLDTDKQTSTFDEAKTKAWINSRGSDGEKAFDRSLKGEARVICMKLWLAEQGFDTRRLSVRDMTKKVNAICDEKNLPSPIGGKTQLRDGRTGDLFDQPVTVGNIYMLKLIHLVEDKVHARATGPYSLISQQPLGGKAQFGGQRFGEMEVWSLEAYGAAHNLQEMLTTKSDDVTGRSKTYEAIVKGEDILSPGVPESFKVLVKELQSLGLSVEVLNEEEKTTSAGKVREASDAGRELPVVEASGLVADETNIHVYNSPDANEGDEKNAGS
ncbi:MAG: DNA-directed RNA polymerase subunit beta [Dehalococcoidia bacterium]|nr:DNA-directed RNA polymerase subunit beta [Dehalococcoidia bacterium]